MQFEQSLAGERRASRGLRRLLLRGKGVPRLPSGEEVPLPFRARLSVLLEVALHGVCGGVCMCVLLER